MKGLLFLVWLFLIALFLGACSSNVDLSDGVKFESVDSTRSKLNFSNDIVENDTLNYFTFPYLYLGGGVAIGDINNDGLQDIYLTGNMVPNKLYLNKGNLQFEDISVTAGVTGDNRWYTGASMLDINADGWMDIYVCVSGQYGTTVNQLFINNKDNTFTERAKDFGLDDASASIQATSIDFDRDGDLDIFVANYPQLEVSQGNHFYRALMSENRMEYSGHLYELQANGNFLDVTDKAGVRNFGLTLGVIASDLNNDGWTDLYLSNDFNVPDYFYINNGDGTFRECLQQSVGHTATFGMGIDAGDFNNDGWTDLAQVDMTPADHVRSKTNMASMSPDAFYEGLSMGFHYQYMQNCLQLNNGNASGGQPVFSEIARMAGFATTDWSWGVLFADWNNDGYKDLYVTNGIARDVNNNDAFLEFDKASFFGTVRDYTRLPSTPISNYALLNDGMLGFVDVTSSTGLNSPGFSNGVAYADFDNDGLMDIVVNNVNSPASLYHNVSSQHQQYLKIELDGPPSNPMGIGAKITIRYNGRQQHHEQTLVRGFQSSVDPIVHFGLGEVTEVDEVNVLWPDGSESVLFSIPSDIKISISYQDAGYTRSNTSPVKPFVHLQHLKSHVHEEDLYLDYEYEPLLPHRNSNLGPATAVGDVNADGLRDLFIGGARGKKGCLLVQRKEGGFVSLNGPWEADSLFEDTGAVLVDIDHDDDLDLLIVSGGNDPKLSSEFYEMRWYMNVNGSYIKHIRMPSIAISSRVLLPMDVDNDGDLDVFIGGRVSPGKYPNPPRSALMINKGGSDLNLKLDQLSDIAMGPVAEWGMITDALWHDVDGNGRQELILTGEWKGIESFEFVQGQFVNNPHNLWKLSENTGWWRQLHAEDLDNDGDVDLIAGNLGLNYKYRASIEHPFSIYGNDFDANGTSDIVLSYDKGGKNLPLRGRECSSQQVPAIARRFETYQAFADASLEDIYGSKMLNKSLHYQATNFAHQWFEHSPEGFISHDLPRLSQISAVNAILAFDYNGDEYQDYLIAGNLYEAEVETPRADASVALILQGAALDLVPVPPDESGLMVQGEVRDILDLGDGLFAFVINNGPVQWWKLSTSEQLKHVASK